MRERLELRPERGLARLLDLGLRHQEPGAPELRDSVTPATRLNQPAQANSPYGSIWSEAMIPSTSAMSAGVMSCAENGACTAIASPSTSTM